MKIYIYRIYFPLSNKCYIGQTNNLKGRLLAHLDSKYLIGKALQKYDDWQVSILHTCKSRDEANRIEIEEIRNFNSIIPNGYNITRGGSDSNGFQTHKHSDETKIKMSESHKGNKNALGFKHSKETKKNLSRMLSERNKGNKYNLGLKHSEETKMKIRQSRLGTKHSEITKIKMRISALRNQIIKFESEINGN